MNKTNDKNTSKNHRTTATVKAKTRCKLGLDVHAASIMVARQVEGLQPQPPQKFKGADFFEWVKGQVEQGFEVFSCYEAGPTGYWLHRKLTELGVTNYVVCPARLDTRGEGGKTEKTAARGGGGAVARSFAGVVAQPVGLFSAGDCRLGTRGASLDRPGEPGGPGLVAAGSGPVDARDHRAGDPGLAPVRQSAPGRR